jgi:digeranylgeranylglycerophospholipid reductase
MPATFDIIIIGAGPAGLRAAAAVIDAHGQARLALIDKNPDPRAVVACAEGVGRLGFHRILDIRPEWIRLVIDKATFHAPDGTAVHYSDRNKGYIINRSLMQRDLSRWCEERGAHLIRGVRVNAVSMRDRDGMRTVQCANGDVFTARVVIDCSGPLSTFGRNEPISAKAPDLEVACFAHVENQTLPKDTVHLFMGSRLAPGGYAWAFPRDATSMNIGLLVGSAWRGSVNIRRLLDDFIESNFGACAVHKIYAGTIPCSGVKTTSAAPGLIKAGDAASTVNPISRAGIVEALISGKLAGETAAAMLAATSQADYRKLCADHARRWNEALGKKHRKLARAKQSLAKIPDQDYVNAARGLSQFTSGELTMSRIFRVSLGRFPRLAWSMRRLM